jgi:hypothetical protein
MKLSIFVLCALSTSALAVPVDLRGWSVEYITPEGEYSRVGTYPSKEACEAAISKEVQKDHGYNGHCIEWKDGDFIGSQKITENIERGNL